MTVAKPDQYSIDVLIHKVLTSDRFHETIKEGERGYYDRQEGIFIPKKAIPSLIKELTVGHNFVKGPSEFEAYISLCQIRTKRFLKAGMENSKIRNYSQIFLRYLSAEFLRMFVNTKLNFAALYIDLVGSTLMSMHISPERFSVLVGAFTREITAIIPIRQGFVLKYAGDAVIAFFPEMEGFSQMCANAIKCALAMGELVNGGINTVLAEAGFEPLKIRIGVEAGVNQIMQIGADVDIVGHTMNMAAKVTSMAKPNGICIGQVVYSGLDQKLKQSFAPMKLDPSFWKYQDSAGKLYQVYEYVGSAGDERQKALGEQEKVNIETPKF